MATRVGVKMLQRYEERLTGYYNEAIEKARSKLIPSKVEEKAWELVGASHLYNKRRDLEKKIRDVEEQLAPNLSVSCKTGQSPYTKVKNKLEKERDRRALAEISGEAVKCYDDYMKLKKEMNKLEEKLDGFGYVPEQPYHCSPSFKDILTKIRNNEEDLVWEELGAKALINEKQHLIDKLTEVAEEEKEYIGGACEVKRQLNQEMFFLPRPVSEEAPIEGARWQARELLYPEINEIREKYDEALRRLDKAAVPTEIAEVVTFFEKATEELVG